jgi:pilus assembly protein FimV
VSPSTEPAEFAQLDEQGGTDQLDELDEVGVKLDLARAYLDMGDSDGARSLLDEVLEEGGGRQRQEAESLLQQIA